MFIYIKKHLSLKESLSKVNLIDEYSPIFAIPFSLQKGWFTLLKSI
jgi:hypothetical protein